MLAGAYEQATFIEHFKHPFSLLGACVAPTFNTFMGGIRLGHIIPIVKFGIAINISWLHSFPFTLAWNRIVSSNNLALVIFTCRP